MELTSFEYGEFAKMPRRWSLKPVHLDHVKLIVGKNATGKTRTLNVIAGLAGLLSAPVQRPYASGTYKASFKTQDDTCRYEIVYLNGTIQSERFTIGKAVYLKRARDGRTTMVAEKLKSKTIDVKVPTDQVAAFVRRDDIQHPYLNALFDWGSSVRHYRMGSSLGKTVLYLPMSAAGENARTNRPLPKPTETVPTFKRGEEEFGRKFSKLVLADMNAAGYDCTEVGLVSLDRSEYEGVPIPPQTIYVKERDLDCPTRQIEMSDGMFAALSLAVHFNYLLLSKRPSCFLIDDIGDNLDFDRSRRIVSGLIEKSLQSGVQVVMTTNNRFIMNASPLEYWSILERRGHTVSEYTQHNSKRIFEEFRYTGLSNFDLFSSGAYKKPKKKRS